MIYSFQTRRISTIIHLKREQISIDASFSYNLFNCTQRYIYTASREKKMRMQFQCKKFVYNKPMYEMKFKCFQAFLFDFMNKIKKRDLLSVFIYLDMYVYNHLELWAHAIQWKRAFEMYCDKSNPIHYFKTIDNDPSEQKLVFDHLKKARSNLS